VIHIQLPCVLTTGVITLHYYFSPTIPLHMFSIHIGEYTQMEVAHPSKKQAQGNMNTI